MIPIHTKYRKKTTNTKTNLVRSRINNNTTLVLTYQSLPIYNHTSMMYIFVIHVKFVSQFAQISTQDFMETF
jgi:hypothetical protein